MGLLERLQGPFAKRPDRDYHSMFYPVSNQKTTELDYGEAERKNIIDPAGGLLGDIGRGVAAISGMATNEIPVDRDLLIKSSVDVFGGQALRGASLPYQAGVLASTPITKTTTGLLGDNKPKVNEPSTMRELITSGVDDADKYIAKINFNTIK